MWKAIVALLVSISAQVAKGQDVNAEETLFRNQLERYIAAHPEEKADVRTKLEPLFRHMQGEWISHGTPNSNTPKDQREPNLKLTVNGLDVTYAELGDDGGLVRAKHGRLQVDSKRVRLRFEFSDPMDKPASASDSGSPSFVLPLWLVTDEWNMRQPKSEAYLFCGFGSANWRAFKPGSHIAKRLPAQATVVSIAADEALFRAQVDRYVTFHPERAGHDAAQLALLFRHMQGEWWSEWAPNARSPFERPKVTLRLTISGLNATYTEVRRDGLEGRSARGRLEVDSIVDSIGPQLSFVFGPQTDHEPSPRVNSTTPFVLPTRLLATEYNMRQPRGYAELSCGYDEQNWRTFESEANFLAGLNLQEQFAAKGPTPSLPIKSELFERDRRQEGDWQFRYARPIVALVLFFLAISIAFAILGAAAGSSGTDDGTPRTPYDPGRIEERREPPTSEFTRPPDEQFKGY
ncbi:MAG: hypothetical protein U0136_12150 [Bdellovibrionota bacterium]